MARTGFSSSNYLSLGTPLVTAYPFTIAGWGLINTTGIQMAFGFDSGASGTQNWWALGSNGSSHIKLETNISGTNFQAVTSTTISTGAWFHAAGVAASAASRAAYLNGGGKGTDTTNATPSGLARTVIGGAAGEQFWKSDGRLAHWTLWNIALSDAEVALLAKGIHPFLIHPEAILGYWPLDGYASPEIELRKNSQALTINGTLSRAAGPALFYPRRLKARRFTTASAGTGVSVTVPLKTFSLTKNVPTVAAGASVAAPAKTFALANFAPSAGTGARVAAPLKVFTLTANAAAVSTGAKVAAPARAFTLTGFAPALRVGGAQIAVPVRAFTLSPEVPAAAAGASVAAPRAIFTLAPQTPTIVAATPDLTGLAALPAASAGLHFVLAQAGVYAAAGDTIRDGASSGTTYRPNSGAAAEIFSPQKGKWFVAAKNGGWTLQ